jgi:hypothetical protein
LVIILFCLRNAIRHCENWVCSLPQRSTITGLPEPKFLLAVIGKEGGSAR